MDPLTKDFPELSSYQYASNSPIENIDLDGLEAISTHGTWSNKETWDRDFSKGMLKATNWSDVQKFMYYANWSGANNEGARAKAADKIYNWIVSDKNPFRDKKHVTLIGHSHGGNVNKMVKNRLGKKGWTVDIINIETPQREKYQSDKTDGVYLNFYENSDVIQWAGTGDDKATDGARIDQSAVNVELDASKDFSEYGEMRKTIFAPAAAFAYGVAGTIDWLKAALGHSLHNNKRTQKQIIDKTTKEFKK